MSDGAHNANRPVAGSSHESVREDTANSWLSVKRLPKKNGRQDCLLARSRSLPPSQLSTFRCDSFQAAEIWSDRTLSRKQLETARFVSDQGNPTARNESERHREGWGYPRERHCGGKHPTVATLHVTRVPAAHTRARVFSKKSGRSALVCLRRGKRRKNRQSPQSVVTFVADWLHTDSAPSRGKT